MEVTNNGQNDNSLLLNKDFLQISCNWQISNNKQFHDAFTVAPFCEEPIKINCDDIVSLNTCISLQPIQSDNEPCMLDIKLINNQRISRIAVVSEAYVLEFFKQFGEYEKTIFAELIDDFEENFIYFAQATINPYSTEASIKFTKTKSKNSVLWIYGIKLYLTEPINEPESFSTEIFNPEIIKNFLTKFTLNNEGNNITDAVQSSTKSISDSSTNNNIEQSNEKEIVQSITENTISNITDITTYIDQKFCDMENRIMKRIEEMEQRTNQKLDMILKQLETQFCAK